MSETMTDNKEQAKGHGALSLMKRIFDEQNASLNEMEDGRFCFSYGGAEDEHGEQFVVEADDEHVTMRLIDPNWHEVSKWDIEEVTRLQKRINMVNLQARCKVVYSFDDNDKMLLSTLMTCPFTEGIPDPANYLRAQLNDMLNCQKFILSNDDDEDDAEKDDDGDEKKGGEA